MVLAGCGQGGGGRGGGGNGFIQSKLLSISYYIMQLINGALFYKT